MIQNRIYSIDDSQLNNLKRRFLIRGLRMVGLMLLVTSIMQILQAKKDQTLIIGMVTLFGGCIFGLSVYRATNKLMGSYKTLQIILTDEGIEMKAEMMPYKIIRWENLMVKTKSNGILLLFDKTISTFTRKMYGKGCIIIYPELADREKLVADLSIYRVN